MIERRKHVRIVTLKNFGWLLLGLTVIFIALSFDLFSHAPASGYGRIVDREIERHEIQPPAPVVTESQPVPDQTAPDPLLIAPAAREQEFLSTATLAPPPPAPMEARGSGVNIVGDSSGVAIVRNGETAKRPVLAGGIFKQP